MCGFVMFVGLMSGVWIEPLESLSLPSGGSYICKIMYKVFLDESMHPFQGKIVVWLVGWRRCCLAGEGKR